MISLNKIEFSDFDIDICICYMLYFDVVEKMSTQHND